MTTPVNKWRVFSLRTAAENATYLKGKHVQCRKLAFSFIELALLETTC